MECGLTFLSMFLVQSISEDSLGKHSVVEISSISWPVLG